ncbi:hypothetical protein V8C86DRAFT_1285688 [Haematococcus lacustris]
MAACGSLRSVPSMSTMLEGSACGPSQAIRSCLICRAVKMLYFIAFLTGVLCAMDTTSGAIKVMANHVKSTGGMALLPAAQKLLFISSRNSLCQLDLQSGECQVITPSLWPEGGRLLTGSEQLALLIEPCTGGSNYFSCSAQGELRHLRCVQHSAVSPDYRLNSRGDLLFFERRGKELARLSCLPALLPPAEATACKVVWPKGGH